MAIRAARIGRWCAATAEDRIRRLRVGGIVAVQAGLAAVLAWLAAHALLGNPDPVFAPIVAVGTLAASVGQRIRRILELITGVTLGVLVGDALLLVIGTGPWQLGVVVILSILMALTLGGSTAVVLQAASTAVLIATLSPSVRNLEVPRFVDAVVGGGSALLVTSVLLPLNPLRVIDRAVKPALDMLAEQLENTSKALTDRDIGRGEQAMARLRRNQPELQALSDAVEGAKEATTLSPTSWRRRRALVHRYASSAEPIDRAMRNSGTLIRRAVTTIEDAEPIPEEMPQAIAAMASGVRMLRSGYTEGRRVELAQQRCLQAVSLAGHAYRRGVGFSGGVVVAQVRTTTSDLFVASGVPQAEANAQVRAAFGPMQAASSSTTQERLKSST